MAPPKPRRYDGPVDFLDAADTVAMSWDDRTLGQVVQLMPYPPERGIRMKDWVCLVAHASSRSGEPPLDAAHRLRQYVLAYQERHQTTLTPDDLKKEN